jgi:hypothetical protein
MRSIRILIPTHVSPDTKSVITLFFENLLPVMKQHVNVHLIWFVYKPEQIQKIKKIPNDVTITDIHDYDNAVELLKKEKPDIIFASATRSFIDYALSSAAKSMKIPTFSMFWSDWYYTTTSSKIQYVKLNISRFFQNSIPTDINQDQKQQMRRGRFFITKYLFLVRTQMALKMNLLQIISNFFLLLKHNFFDAAIDSRFANTLHFLEDKKLKNSLIESGFDKSTLIVTGNPIFDESLQNSLKQKNSFQDNKKIRILLAPSTLYEHGFWNKEQRDFSVTEIVKRIHKINDKMSIIVKIHPSTSILYEYKSIIDKIDSSIPVYQEGDIQEFFENIDLVISFESSTAEMYAIIAKKPIIICNFFHSKPDVLVKIGLAIECIDPSNLLKSIEKANHILEYDKKRSDFIDEYFYKPDGRASERISDALLKLLTKNIL